MSHYGLHDINKQMVTSNQCVLQCVLPSLQFGLTAHPVCICILILLKLSVHYFACIYMILREKML